ncbi:MAG: glycosyltransferase family 4 protein [Thermofilum sp.]
MGHYLNPGKTRKGSTAPRDTGGKSKTTIRDPLTIMYNCSRQDKGVALNVMALEILYLPYLLKLETSGIIVMNPHAVYAARASRRKVIVDLMDFWSCELDRLHLNVMDYKFLKKANLVIAWSKAIYEILNRLGISVEYLPFAVDLSEFDPLSVPSSLFLEKYPHVSDRVRVAYSGGVWEVGGKDVLGVEKLVKAFKLVEEKEKNVVLLLQTSPKVVELARSYGVKNVVKIERTPYNDPLRLSFFRAADIMVLTGSRYPAVYLAERTTMFQYMASGNAIVAESTLGTRGVLEHGKDAYIIELDQPKKLAEAILELAKDEGLRKYLGKNARVKLERTYTWEKLAERARKLLESV